MRNASRYILLVIILLLVVSLCSGFTILKTPQALAKRSAAYAIYLSPGPYDGIKWGGYHITVTSYSDNHAPGKSEKIEAKNAWYKVNGQAAYHFDKKQRNVDYFAHNLGNGYGICLKSDRLDRLAWKLHKEKFDNQKQLGRVQSHDKCRWHISLRAKTPEEAIHRFEKYLKHKPWKLYEVRYPGTPPSACWTEIT